MTAEFVVAVHSVVFLNHKKTFLSSDEIAINVCTNPARVRKVMLQLKKAGIVETKGGYVGGYEFSKDPKTVTLYDIFAATSKHFVKVTWRSGDPCLDCPIAQNMAPIMDDVFDQLDESCKNTLAKMTIDDIDKRIFPRES